ALAFFENVPKVRHGLQSLVDVGLGYLSLGQSSTTLSGGEAQRIKLATELSRAATGRSFYLLDEPTTGLHFDDVQRLLQVLDRLVEGGNTVLVIEHHSDLLMACDWLVDLGPGGGQHGGQIVAEGPPEVIAANESSLTGRAFQV
ncbi:MAG: AAA family ATPase, partial [Planctomycetota bacterium]